VTPTTFRRQSFNDSGFFSRTRSPASRITDPQTPSRLSRTNSDRTQNDFLTSAPLTQNNPAAAAVNPSASASLPQPAFGSTLETSSYSSRTNLGTAHNGFLASTAALAHGSIETDRVNPLASASRPSPPHDAESPNNSSLPQSSRYYLPHNALTPQAISQGLLDQVKRNLLPTEVDRRTIYGFRESADSEFMKIGVTNNFDRRMQELGAQCGYKVGHPVFRFEVSHAGRVERLLQRYFAAERRVEDVTRLATQPDCRHARHIEWFQIGDERVKVVAERWRLWMEMKPYHTWDHPMYKTLSGSWRLKLAEIETESTDEDHWAKWLDSHIPIIIPEPIVEVEAFEQAADSDAVSELVNFPVQLPAAIAIPAIIPDPMVEAQSPQSATDPSVATEAVSLQAQLPIAIAVPPETETSSSTTFVFGTRRPFSFRYSAEPRTHIPTSVSVGTQSSRSLVHHQTDISPFTSSSDLGLTLPPLVHLSFRVAQFLLILCIFGNISYAQFASISILALITFSFSSSQNIGFFPTNPLKVMDRNHDFVDVAGQSAAEPTESAKDPGAEAENSGAARNKQEEILYPDLTRAAAEAMIPTQETESRQLGAQEMREINVMLRDLVAEMAGQGRRRPVSWSGP